MRATIAIKQTTRLTFIGLIAIINLIIANWKIGSIIIIIIIISLIVEHQHFEIESIVIVELTIAKFEFAHWDQ